MVDSASVTIDSSQDEFRPDHDQFPRKRHPVKMLFSLTVGKVDAGVAVLLTQDKRLVCSNIGFPDWDALT